MNQRQTLLAGAIFGFLAVAVGAFGAHALKPVLIQSGKTDVYELAVKYQFYHALALLLVGCMMQGNASSWLGRSAIAFVVGVILFSGSLYFVAFASPGLLALVTPMGGIFLLSGWAALAMAFLKNK